MLTLGEVAKATEGRINSSADINSRINGVFTDSREADKAGKLFVALKGEHTDAHMYVKDMLAAGCFALIDNPKYFMDGTVLVQNTKTALQSLALWYRREKLTNTKIIAVTGSVGKTTTKDMVALALSGGMRTGKTQGNKNSQTGLPLSILEISPDNQAAVLEIGMSEPGEITKLSRIAVPDLAIITNIGYSHIEFLGSRENICAEKLSVADYMPEDGLLVLNGDEPMLRNISRPQRRLYCSVMDSGADCFATDIIQEEGHTCFTANIMGDRKRLSIKTVGLHNVMNALFALTAAALLEVDIGKAADKLAGFTAGGLRQNIYKKDGYTVIADCYNASPESMAAALAVLGSYKGRKIAVLGDMLELGGYSAELHRKVGELVLENKIDILVTFGTLARDIAGAAEGKMQVYSIGEGEYDKAAELLRAVIVPGDTVLYKASNRMQLQRIIDAV